MQQAPSFGVGAGQFQLEQGVNLGLRLHEGQKCPPRGRPEHGHHRAHADADCHGHLTFGYGSHQCMGKNLSRMSLADDAGLARVKGRAGARPLVQYAPASRIGIAVGPGVPSCRLEMEREENFLEPSLYSIFSLL